MDIPRFTPESINHRIASGDIGDAFQLFVYEVLQREYPHLHRFPAGGKDGGIDLIDASNGNVVIECKFVGDDKYQSVEGRWKDVRKRLQKHLEDPNGPTLGQSQYGPWYSALDPVGQYWFCVSSSIDNENQRRDLRDSITALFQSLASQYPHLSHLRDLTVNVVDWNDLTRRLQQQPHLIFRWFPSSRPLGLVPLDEETDVGTFRAYLTKAKLPYYSVAEHLTLMPAPKNSAILDEETLLASFDSPEITGLVISGKGGIGKSRLTLELGWLAVRQGWSVLRVQSRLKEDALEKLAEKLTPDAPVLLLVDYIETQSDFGELVETINVLNDSAVARLRYVAACRTNFYYRAIATSERHLPVDLTPPPGSLTIDWFTSYRQQTVERILTEGGLPNDEKYLAVCKNVPILAVFLAYLHTSGRSDDLAELLGEVEFGRWVAKRVQLTFPHRDIYRELALLIPLFPMPESSVSRFPQTIYTDIFDNLATDGWSEKIPATEPGVLDTWVTAHDVLADQILLAYARSIPETTERFIGELFSLAASVGCLGSAIVSLQRLSDTPPLSSVRWLKVISQSITENETAWYGIRGLLIRTTLLPTREQLTLLRDHERLWTGAEEDPGFQKTLGWLARRIIKHQEEVSEQEQDTLVQWIIKAAPLAQRSNFVIAWGLRLAPAALKDTALKWITTKPTLLQTHYLMVAWLEYGLGPEPIAPYVQQWSLRFSHSFHLSFLVEAWLDAGGDPELVREAIADWLIEHCGSGSAEFVYKAWLDAGGDTALVREAIAAWLVEQSDSAGTNFVCKAWLDAGGDKPLVQATIENWVLEHGGSADAQYVYKAWLGAGGDKTLVRQGIKDWLIDHGGSADAQYVYKAWLGAGGDKTLVRQGIKDWLVDHGGSADAQYVYKAWLGAGGDKTLVRQGIKDWLVEYGDSADAPFVYNTWLKAGGDKTLVQQGIQHWLVEHSGSTAAQFIYNAWLDAGGDKALVQEAIQEWLREHGATAGASHVYKAWLDSGGDPSLVYEPVKRWLVEHERSAEADFVFVAWLEAGGDSALVEEAIKHWLKANGNSIGATHVYKTWYDVGGKLSVIWDAVIAWLAEHSTEESAVYVTTFIAKQKNLTAETIRHILIWCRTFPANENALWRLTQLGKHVLRPEVAGDFILTSEVVLAYLLEPSFRPSKQTKEQISLVFFNLITSNELQSSVLRRRVDNLFMEWIRHPSSFGPSPTPFWRIQSAEFLNRISTLLDARCLDVAADAESLKQFMQWLNAWDVDAKLRLLPILSKLRAKYPTPQLWELLVFD